MKNTIISALATLSTAVGLISVSADADERNELSRSGGNISRPFMSSGAVAPVGRSGPRARLLHPLLRRTDHSLGLGGRSLWHRYRHVHQSRTAVNRTHPPRRRVGRLFGVVVHRRAGRHDVDHVLRRRRPVGGTDGDGVRWCGELEYCVAGNVAAHAVPSNHGGRRGLRPLTTQCGCFYTGVRRIRTRERPDPLVRPRYQ